MGRGRACRAARKADRSLMLALSAACCAAQRSSRLPSRRPYTSFTCWQLCPQRVRQLPRSKHHALQAAGILLRATRSSVSAAHLPFLTYHSFSLYLTPTRLSCYPLLHLLSFATLSSLLLSLCPFHIFYHAFLSLILSLILISSW